MKLRFQATAMALSLAALAAEAHDFHRPVRPLVAGNVFGANHAGFGFLNAQSEADAGSIIQFGCTDASRISYLETACNRTFAPGTRPEDVVTDAMRAMVLQQVREKAFEYLTLQAAAADPASRGAIQPLPACIPSSSEAARISGQLMDHVPTQAEIRAMPEGPAKALAWKHRAVGSQFFTHNLMRAMILMDRIDRSQREAGCGPNVTGDIGNYCIDLQQTRLRLAAAYPALFRAASISSDGHTGSVSAVPEYEALRRATQLLVGSHGAADRPEAERLARGQGFYETGTQRHGFTHQPELENLVVQARQAASAADAPAALREAENTLADLVTRIRANSRTNAARDATRICDKSLLEMMVLHPAAVRQTLLDLDETGRAQAKAILCEHSAALVSARGVRQCHGISGGPLPGPNPVVSAARTYGFPAGSERYVTISQPTSTSPRTVSVTVNIAIDPDLDQAEMRARIQEWERKTSDWYACQVGAVSRFSMDDGGPPIPCPQDPTMVRTPPVRFQIRLNPVTDGTVTQPYVRLHRCYHALVQPYAARTDCQAVREHYVTDCMARWQTREECEAATPPEGSPELNRADAANYTYTTRPGTIAHEVGHIMGMPDEYSDDIYPFNQLGEHVSIMGEGSGRLTSRLFPRHLDQVLEPTRCGARR